MEPYNPLKVNLLLKRKLKRIDNQPASRTKKRECIKNGYQWQMSFYGAIENNETYKARYTRIEVFSDTPYTKPIIKRLLTLFTMYPPNYPYSIYVYKAKKSQIAMVGKYE